MFEASLSAAFILSLMQFSVQPSLCLSQFQLGTSPRQPPGISSKNLPGGRYLTFESCTGAGNSTRTGILWKMKVKLQKIAWIKFLQVKKKQVEFFTFLQFYVFSRWNFSWSIFWFCYHTYLTKNLRSCPWLVYI